AAPARSRRSSLQRWGSSAFISPRKASGAVSPSGLPVIERDLKPDRFSQSAAQVSPSSPRAVTQAAASSPARVASSFSGWIAKERMKSVGLPSFDEARQSIDADERAPRLFAARYLDAVFFF